MSYTSYTSYTSVWWLGEGHSTTEGVYASPGLCPGDKAKHTPGQVKQEEAGVIYKYLDKTK